MVFAPLIARSSGAAIARRTIIAPAVRFASTSSPLKASPSPSSLLSASAFKSLSRSNVSKALQSAKVEVAGNQALATRLASVEEIFNSSTNSVQNAKVNQKALAQLLKGVPSNSVVGSKLNQIAYSALPGLGMINLDAPEPWQYGFQDGASVTMEGITELHNAVMYFVVAIMVGVVYAMGAILYRFRISKNPISSKYLNHGTLIELIWTITPAFVLIAVAFPSFRLLYLMDEVISPALTLKVMGHQWYWSYEYCDFINSEEDDE